jgi:TRAP-type C4-dicarboxylate transport system permease small subunit
MKYVDWVLARIHDLCLIVTGCFLVFMTVTFGWLVYGRYVLNETPTWVEQSSLLLIMGITFIGAAVGIHERSHLAVDIFKDLCPVWLRRILSIMVHLMLAGFGAVMAVQSYNLAVFKWGSQIPLIDLPEGLRAVPITICGALILVFSIRHIIGVFQGNEDRPRHEVDDMQPETRESLN